MEGVKITITGWVQGVFFRKYTKQQAILLNLVGTVKNTNNGQVECIAIGSKENINKFITWCWQGSPLSKVESVLVEELGSEKNYTSFDII